jgi:hypothetical protein
MRRPFRPEVRLAFLLLAVPAQGYRNKARLECPEIAVSPSSALRYTQASFVYSSSLYLWISGISRLITTIAPQPSYFFGIVIIAELPLGFTILSNTVIGCHSEFMFPPHTYL